MIYESEIDCKAVLTGQEICKRYETATVVDDCSKCVNGVQPNIYVLPTGNFIWKIEPTPSFWEWLLSFFSQLWE